jgi:hypothetical protein
MLTIAQKQQRAVDFYQSKKAVNVLKVVVCQIGISSIFWSCAIQARKHQE